MAVFSVLMQFCHTLRFELTFLAALGGLWILSQLSTSRQKPKNKAKVGKEPMIPHEGGKATAQAVEVDSPPTAVGKLGPINQIDAKQLRDASWLVPQVTYMCRNQMGYSLALYRAALQAGLSLQEVPEKDCQQLFVALVTSAIRTGQMDDAMKLLRDLRQLGPGVCIELFASVTKLCTSKHLFAESLAVYDFMVQDPNFVLNDRSVWSCMLFSAIEVRAYDRCTFFFESLKACDTPSHKDYGNMMRLASMQGDWQLSLKLIKEMQGAGIDIDSVTYNTSLATCVGANQVDEARALLDVMERTEALADVITYNTLMKGYAKGGRMEQCTEVFDLMKTHKVAPSQVTYGILLDGYINENQLEKAAQIFSTMGNEGCIMNTVLYTTLIKGFARSGEVDQAMQVYEQMRTERNVTPDLITFSILIKANCDADRLEGSLKLLEAMTDRNLRPDEVVFNSLLTGCARQSNYQLGTRLYQDMVSCGIKPSNATFSILIRFYHQCKCLEEAVEMLSKEPAKHKVEPEPRLYLQLIQSCIRERQGRRAVEVYEMSLERTKPTPATHGSMISTCLKLNMFDTAAEFLAIAASKGLRVDARDANALLDGAIKKRKTQIAREVAGTMTKLGLTPDPRLLSSLA